MPGRDREMKEGFRLGGTQRNNRSRTEASKSKGNVRASKSKGNVRASGQCLGGLTLIYKMNHHY